MIWAAITTEHKKPNPPIIPRELLSIYVKLNAKQKMRCIICATILKGHAQPLMG
jgi:hypothetical protein